MSEPLKLTPDELGLLLTMLALSSYPDAVDDSAEQQAADLFTKLTTFAETNQDEPVVIVTEKQALIARLMEQIVDSVLLFEHHMLTSQCEINHLEQRIEQQDGRIAELETLVKLHVGLEERPVNVFEVITLPRRDEDDEGEQEVDEP